VNAPKSKIFAFEKLLSKTDFCQSWLCTGLTDNRHYFVKFPTGGDSINSKAVKTIFTESFFAQKPIRTSHIVTAIGKHVEQGQLFVIYPFIDADRHQALDAYHFKASFPESLYQVCLIVDYLHILNRVHRDLKFANFSVIDNAAGTRITLNDLDFLTINGQAPQAKIMGSRDHIAPEIMRNDTITTQSDIYSIGASIRHFLYWLEKQGNTDNCNIPLKELRSFGQWCMEEEPSHRPRSLLDALLKSGLGSEEIISGLQKRLFAMVAISRFLNRRQMLNRKTLGLRKFLLDEVRLFGVPASLISDYERAYHIHRPKAFSSFCRLIQRADIKRHIKYWHMMCSDEQLLTCYDELSEIDSTIALPSVAVSGGTAEIMKLLDSVKKLKQKNGFLKALLTLKKNLDLCRIQPEARSNPLCNRIYHSLGTLASGLNRSHEAIDFMTRSLQRVSPATAESIDILLDLIPLCLSQDDIPGALTYIERGLNEARERNSDNHELHFLRWRAWTYGLQAEYDRADDILDSIYHRSRELNFHEMTIKVLNDFGALAWRRGDYTEAREKYQASIKTAKQYHLSEAAISATVNLAVSLFELAHYQESIRYSKRAIAEIDRSGSDRRIAPLLLSIFHCYVRLGEYSRAEYWLHCYWANAVRQLDSSFISIHNAYRGWLALNQFDFARAEDLYYGAIEMQNEMSSNKLMGNVYQSLAEMSLYQGKTESCHTYADKACELFSHMDNFTSLVETKAIEQICEIYDGKTPVQKSIEDTFTSLLDNNCYYYAALFLLHFLLRFDNDDLRKLIDRVRTSASFLPKSSAPVFKALKILLYPDSEGEIDGDDTLRRLKKVYGILDKAQHYFLNILVCMKIADHYRYRSRNRLARRFYRQADNLARRLHNNAASKIIHMRVETMSQKEPDISRRGDILFQISAIMKDIHNYETALEKIIQFAVDETGAERGVLILCARDSHEMRVKTSVNCDDSDISDVLAISRSIPRTVAESTKPLLIDDATQDKRTKDLSSVLMHNIKSVLCLPIGTSPDLYGILYLDHHTIPALFDSSDMVFVSSMTNFLAIMLGALESIRVTQTSTSQLRSELTSLGAGDTFIAIDPETVEILEKLPDIARTNANILITGESGTGKEVLCHNIVRLSLRADRPLVKLNCAAIPTSLIESELFGVAKGVATGVEKRPGKFIAADGGTLFLDEIADMPLDIQAKVLRVLEYQQFEPVGSNRTVSTDIRFIYATNKDIQAMVEDGAFRKDLYYRINTITINLPPLRERPQDIMALTDHFIDLFSRHSGPAPTLTDDARKALLAYAWPGNVRELRNFVEKLCIVSPGMTMSASDLPQEITKGELASDMAKAKAAALERIRIRDLLLANDFNQSRVARIMNIPLSTLRRKIKNYDIKKN